MDLNLTLPSDLGSQLAARADQQGVAPEELALSLLARALAMPADSERGGDGWFSTHVYDDPH